MTPKRIKIALVEKSNASNYWRRAQELLTGMNNHLMLGHWNAAVIDGVHAVISANDAITVAATGRRCTSDDHRDAVEVLKQSLPPNSEMETTHLKKILHIKSHVEYGPSLVPEKEARDVAKTVERFLSWAEGIYKKIISRDTF